MNQSSKAKPSAEDKEQQSKQDRHQAETKKNLPEPNTSQSSPETEASGSGTQPTPPDQVSEAGGPLPELDEGPPPTPVDDIQSALVEAAREGVPTDVDFDKLPKPKLDLEAGAGSAPVDDIQEAIRDASRQGISPEIDFEALPPPMLDLDDGPPPEPIDDIQEAIFESRHHGVSPEMDFDELPEPRAVPSPQKKISRPTKPVETDPTTRSETMPAAPPQLSVAEIPKPDSQTVPLPTFPEPLTLANFWLILALFVTFRLLTLFLLRPGGFIRDWSDFDTFLGIAGLSDYSLFPFLDFWLEWPPLMPWLAVGAYRLSLFFPPWTDDPRLWFVLILGGLFVLFEIGNFILIYRLAARLFQTPAMRHQVLWLYALLFPPIYAMLGFFDGVALFFILLALDLLLENQRIPSAIVIGIGFLVKLIPVLMLPIALRRLWYQDQKNQRDAGIEMGLYAVVFGLTVIVLLAPFLIAGPEWVLASARSILGRSSWETVWALAENYYGFGVVLGDRLNPNETNFAVHEGFLPWWLITLAFFGIYAYVFTRPADYNQPRSMVALSGLTMALFMLYSKGYSPQFLVYLLPFIILLFPNGRGVTYALILTGLNVLEQPIYFVLLPQATWLLIFVVIARFVIFTVLALEFAVALWPTAIWSIRVGMVRKRIPLVFGSLAAVALVVLTPLMLQAYTANRLSDSPIGTIVGFLNAFRQNPSDLANCENMAESRYFLVSDQAAYRELYPHLSGEFDLRLTTGAPEQSSFPTVTDFLPQTGAAWILPTGPQARPLSNAASRRGQLLASLNFDGLGTVSLYRFPVTGTMRPCLPLARFSGDIELWTHHVEKISTGVNVNLYWQAGSAQNQSLTVFTQLLNSEGQQVAGHDSIPGYGTAPTTGWGVDTVQVDSHRIELPPNLPSGEYRLITGLYNASGTRIRSFGPNGQTYPNQAVPLGTIRLP